MKIKPMLAGTLEKLEDVKFPVCASPKLDGIRCLILHGMAMTRTLKPIPNAYIQRCLSGLPNGLDGELMLYEGDFNDVQSAVMSEDGEPDFFYAVFDYISEKDDFVQRIHAVNKMLLKNKQPIKIVHTVEINDLKHLKEFEQIAIDGEYEGIMLRAPNGLYKFGRSTLKEGYLLKYKRFKDSEGWIIGYEELQHNNNTKYKDNLGYAKRSTKKAGLVGKSTLGALCVYDDVLKKSFDIGTGFTAEQRQEIWDNQKKHLGATITYTYQRLTYKGTPLVPVFKGFRYET